MRNLIQICNSIQGCYNQTMQVLGNGYVFSLRMANKWENNCIEYLINQSGVNALVKEWTAIEQDKEGKIKEYQSDFQNRFGFSFEPEFNSSQKRIVYNNYNLNDSQLAELNLCIAPLEKTYDLFTSLTSKYHHRESPKILGNNWKLQKIFANHKHTKGKEIDKHYVLDDILVNEIINNYFLLVKCGFNPAED
jgi:hypothetical protein